MARLRTVLWSPLFVFVIVFSSCVLAQNCAEPAGVANAEILTSSPYASGSLVTYRCYSGFTMSGSPSQLCSSGTWTGTAPTCSFISKADVHEQNVEFKDESGDTMMYAMIILIGLVFLIMVILLIIALCIICRRFGGNCRRGRKAKKVKIKRGEVRPNPGQGSSFRQTRIASQSSPPSRASSPASESARTPRMVDFVDEVMAENRFAQPAKELSSWRPFSKPVRNINTSTQ